MILQCDALDAGGPLALSAWRGGAVGALGVPAGGALFPRGAPPSSTAGLPPGLPSAAFYTQGGLLCEEGAGPPGTLGNLGSSLGSGGHLSSLLHSQQLSHKVSSTTNNNKMTTTQKQKKNYLVLNNIYYAMHRVPEWSYYAIIF